ncbi:MAG: HAD-IIA family hydrolase [Anaerolineales bacterium]|nr:HAD-IIA family hydrolase [Anaerolineales bacterium]
MIDLAKFNTILFDGDGVLWRADEPIDGIKPLFSLLNDQQINWALLTNNNTKTAQHYANKLIKFGAPADPSLVFTSSTATAAYVLENYGPNAALHVVGMDGLLITLEEAGFKVSTGETPPDHPVVAVVSGMDRQITHDKIKVAMRLIMGGADFIATNTDGSFVTPEGFNPGTGMVIGALQFASGTIPTVMGKPEAAIYHTALKRFNANPADTLMVGDRLNTDILGANRLGITTAMVLTGVNSRQDAANGEIKPDMIYQDIRELYQALKEAHA